jgi:chromosome segregation ATPase
MVTEYIQTSCRGCSRILRVRLEYVGHQIACNYCGQTFLATSRDPRLLQFLLKRDGPVNAAAPAPDQPDAIEGSESAPIHLEAGTGTAHTPAPGQLPLDQQARDAFEQERTALKCQLEQALSQSANLRAELAAAAREVEVLGHQRDQLSTDRAELEQRWREAESREERQLAALAAAQSQCESERQQHQRELQTLAQSFEQERQHLQSLINSFSQQTARLERERETRAGQLEQWRARVAALEQKLNETRAEARHKDQSNQQHERALTKQIQSLSLQLGEIQTRASDLDKYLARATGELQATHERTESERQAALHQLALEQARYEDDRNKWQEQMASIEQQSLQWQQGLEIELQQLRDEVTGLRTERERLLLQIDALERDFKRARADGDELVLARKSLQRSIVKIARLTRSLANAWKRIELLRKRYQELALRVTEKVDETHAKADARDVSLKIT